jgi:hypothetical protein
MTFAGGNPDPDLGQAHKCGVVKTVNGIITNPFLIIGSPTEIQI